jgi:hypothetical protein
MVGARMALVSPSRPRPAITIRIIEERRRRVRRVVPAVATTVGVALLLLVAYGPSFVNYDAQWALVWARDLWHGFAPEYTADFAPTPHPLATAVSSFALPFGHNADLAMLGLTLLCFGALVYVTYELGAELFSPWVGLVAALVVLTRPAMERDALLGYQDIAFALLVIGAVLLEARRPRRGVAAGHLRDPPKHVRPRAPRARDLGRDRLADRRRSAALAARDGRPGRGGGPATGPPGRPVLDRQVLRLRAA